MWPDQVFFLFLLTLSLSSDNKRLMPAMWLDLFVVKVTVRVLECTVYDNVIELSAILALRDLV